jgi:hypothetical protein
LPPPFAYGPCPRSATPLNVGFCPSWLPAAASSLTTKRDDELSPVRPAWHINCLFLLLIGRLMEPIGSFFENLSGGLSCSLSPAL